MAEVSCCREVLCCKCGTKFGEKGGFPTHSSVTHLCAKCVEEQIGYEAFHCPHCGGEYVLPETTLARLRSASETGHGHFSVISEPISEPVTGHFSVISEPVTGHFSVISEPESEPLTGHFSVISEPLTGHFSVISEPVTGHFSVISDQDGDDQDGQDDGQDDLLFIDLR